MAKRSYDIEIDSYIGYPISKTYIREELARCGNRPVTVRINSYGGDVCTALDIRQQFLDHGDVTCYVFGMTASAATILATGAKKLYMGRHAFMLLHQCSMLVDKWDWLNADELESTIEELKKTCTDLHKLDMCAASLYAKRAGCDPEKMHGVMVDAQWLNADECLALGLVDAIDEEEEDEPVQMTAAVQRRFAACGLPALPAAKVEEKQEQAPKVSLMDSLANIVAAISTWLTAGKQEEPATAHQEVQEEPAAPPSEPVTEEPAAAVESQAEEPAAAAPQEEQEEQEPEEPAAPSPEPEPEDTAATIASLQAELAEARQRIAELEAMDGDDTTPAMPCTAAEYDTAMQHCSDFVRRYKHLI